MKITKLQKTTFHVLIASIAVPTFLICVSHNNSTVINGRTTVSAPKNGQESWKIERLQTRYNVTYEMYMMYAYYDHRKLLNENPFVRIFIILPKEGYETLKEKLFCHLWKSNIWSRHLVNMTCFSLIQNPMVNFFRKTVSIFCNINTQS